MKSNKSKPSGTFKIGAISLAFMILGYQIALFVHRAAVEKIVANRDHPDTVFVLDRAVVEDILADGNLRAQAEEAARAGAGGQARGAGGGGSGSRAGAVGAGSQAVGDRASGSGGRGVGTQGSRAGGQARGIGSRAEAAGAGAGSRAGGGAGVSASGQAAGGIAVRKNAPHSPAAKAIAQKNAPKKVESFAFNPNTASTEDLMRLGFSEKQAASIDKYRSSGGRFHRKSDFAKSYVVSDSVYQRLEKYISIPLTDINTADSADFDALPGIGGWFAKNMVQYRARLGGYSCKEQLMEIYRFDAEKFASLQDLITCSAPKPYPLWSAPVDSLRTHPHIGGYSTARAIVFYREHNPKEKWTIGGLEQAGVLSAEQAKKLRLCKIAEP